MAGDDELIFADSADGALRKAPAPDPKSTTRPVRGRGGPRRRPGRRPPPAEVANRPHVLVSAVFAEPVLLSRDKRHLVGRGDEASLRIRTDRVSRRHAEIHWNGRCFVLRDLASTNGTELNGRPVPPMLPIPLHDGDVLGFGGYEVRLNVLQPGEFPDEGLGGRTRKMRRVL
ncbi:MAG: FHA domain-containing protein [Planctomycetota bacterium]|nr:MAG: FHA domain-containing protein [Planctomycetota bacterium]